MSSDIAIKVENLSKCYQIYDQPYDRLKQSIYPRLRRFIGKQPKQYFREFWALRDVSLQVKKGETVGIIGRNGSGKSTLLQMICGTLYPTSGSIHTTGRIAALLELGSGFNPEFTGRENVYMNAALFGLNRTETDLRFADIVDFADIGDFIDQPVKTYSSGMMVRLAFAVIAHVDADILVVDEALAVGDAFFTQKCMRYLRNFMTTGTVLFVSHDTSTVKNLCTRAIWIDRGSVQILGSPKNVCEEYLEALYEVQQGEGSVKCFRRDADQLNHNIKDPRQEIINASNLRNDIRLFKFNPSAPSFGKGGAQIISVRFLDAQYKQLAWIVGGEDVILRIEAVAHSALDSPIIGFFIKDKLGQNLFGDNTYITYMDSPVICDQGQFLTAEFGFQMPRLLAGDYSITVAIANGSQHDHVPHHWVHDAIFFKSESTSVASGLVGIPMKNIKFEIE
ncbi:MAG: ABC transporter ATP-binding protein [Bacteroidota bacterium]